MSAYIVSRKHIAALAHFMVAEKVWDLPEAAAMATTLMQENIRSVAYRYPNDPPVSEPEFKRAEILAAPLVPPLHVLSACYCLEYQSCETADYEQTEGARVLHRIISNAVHALPGFHAAPWGIE